MIAYLDLPSGLSGDMLLGCLVDGGWNAERLRATVEALHLDSAEWAIEVMPVLKHSLRATRVQVLAEERKYQRRLADVVAIIDASELPAVVRERAIAVFNRLANAEAKVHGTTPDQIHFHEVGAVDAVIDIVASVNGLHELGVERLYCSPIPLGAGWTDSAHGRLPLPAPATMELLSAARVPTRPAPGAGELLTPTAAAILAELATFEQPAITLSRIGIGAGQKDFAWPNIARIWLGESQGAGQLVQLETNIDDMNPQLYAPLFQTLLNAGAKDVWLTPVQMKKGRPGAVLAVLALAKDEAMLADVIFRETTTLGVRVHEIRHRHEARREIRAVSTPFGDVHVKVKWIGTEAVDAVPEYEDCRLIAERTGTSLLRVHQAAMVAGQALLGELRGSGPAGS
jgi:pyridinium-3,5-bisthiocarboxylic acid mononucleotide nickel chelatase